MSIDKEYVEQRMNSKFICSFCGKKEFLKNGFTELCSIGGHQHTTYNWFGGGTRHITMYLQHFRICKECEETKRKILKWERITRSVLLVMGLLYFLIGLVFALPYYWIGSIIAIGLLLFYRLFRDLFCLFFKRTRKSINVSVAKQNLDSIGEIPQLWDFPTYIPKPIDGLEYESDFFCPMCHDRFKLSSSKSIKLPVGKTEHFSENWIVETELIANVRVCCSCYDKIKGSIGALKMALIIILSILGISTYIIASLKNGRFEVYPFFFLVAVLSGCYYFIIFCYSKAKFKIKTRNINKEYAALKNLNAIE